MDSILLAIAAPAFIALGGLFSAELRTTLSVFGLTFFRVGGALALLAVAAVLTGNWRDVTYGDLTPLLVSGLVGMLVSDAALSGAIFAIGASNALVVFSLNAVFAGILGWVFLSESLMPADMIGIFAVIAGVALALSQAKDSDISIVNPAQFASGLQSRALRRQLAFGIGLGVLAAFAQALSGMLARPVMASGIGADAAMSVRLAGACLVLAILAMARGGNKRETPPVTGKTLALGFASAWLGIGCGVTFFFASLKGVNIATAATLASTTPLWVLHMNWIRTREFPGWRPLTGAGLALLGAYFILR